MRVFLFMFFSGIAAYSQIPSNFTLCSISNETRFLYFSGKEASVSLPNFIADCCIRNDSCFCHTIQDSQGVAISSIDSCSVRRFSSLNNNLFILERSSCRLFSQYILDFSNNTFIGGNFVCSSDIKGVVTVNDFVKGNIRGISDSTTVTVSAPDRCPH